MIQIAINIAVLAIAAPHVNGTLQKAAIITTRAIKIVIIK